MGCLFQLRSVWLKDGAEEDCIVSINNEVMLGVALAPILLSLIWSASNQPNPNSVGLINRSYEDPDPYLHSLIQSIKQLMYESVK